MELTGTALTDFKAFERAELQIAPITILIGPNNSGKSTVLQALALLAQSVPQGRLLTRMTGLDLGSTPDVLIRRPSGASKWAIEVRWQKLLGADHPVAPNTTIDISFSYEGHRGNAWLSVADVVLDAPIGRRLTVRCINGGQRTRAVVEGPELRTATMQVPAVSTELPTDDRIAGDPFRFGVATSSGEERNFTSQMVLDPRGAVAYAQNSTAGILRDHIALALSGFTYVPATRAFLETSYNLHDQVPATLTRADEAVSSLAYDRELLEAVASRTRAVLNVGLRTDLVPNRLIDLTGTVDNGTVASIANMGSGMGQVAYLAVHLERHLRRWTGLSADGSRIEPGVGIDEPEVHLHPAAQARLAEMLRIYATSGLRIILTTQSEHILIAFLNMVARGLVAADQLRVYYVSGGTVEPLPVNERGSLNGGLKGFFEAGEHELLERLEALIRQEGGEPPAAPGG